MQLRPLTSAVLAVLTLEVFTSDDEERLMVDVFRGYNSLIQDEKNQVMHTNVWLTLKWHDFQMRWNPVDYGEIREIRVTPDKVWLPDIVLFN
ncbi:hypothetical protein OSTOST_16487, partial [Ostertagia ostertagi]